MQVVNQTQSFPFGNDALTPSRPLRPRPSGPATRTRPERSERRGPEGSYARSEDRRRRTRSAGRVPEGATVARSGGAFQCPNQLAFPGLAGGPTFVPELNFVKLGSPKERKRGRDGEERLRALAKLGIEGRRTYLLALSRKQAALAPCYPGVAQALEEQMHTMIYCV